MAINNSISTHDWLELSSEVRQKLVKIFNIPRSGVGHINYTAKGPEVTSDGYTHEDLKAISVEKMQVYLNSQETEFSKLFDIVLVWLDGPMSPQLEPKESPQLSQEEKIESWNKILEGIRIDAETNGLLTEYNKFLKKQIKIKK